MKTGAKYMVVYFLLFLTMANSYMLIENVHKLPMLALIIIYAIATALTYSFVKEEKDNFKKS